MNRRGFIRGLIAAPFAGKAAAEKVALTSIQGAGLGTNMLGVPPEVPGLHPSNYNEYDWCREGLKRLLDPKYLQRIRDETFVSHLDPDLAACNSFSLAARFTLQRERLVERQIRSQRSRFETTLQEAGLL